MLPCPQSCMYLVTTCLWLQCWQQSADVCLLRSRYNTAAWPALTVQVLPSHALPCFPGLASCSPPDLLLWLLFLGVAAQAPAPPAGLSLLRTHPTTVSTNSRQNSPGEITLKTFQIQEKESHRPNQCERKSTKQIMPAGLMTLLLLDLTNVCPCCDPAGGALAALAAASLEASQPPFLMSSLSDNGEQG